MGDYLDCHTVLSEYDTNFKKLTGLSRPDENGQREVTLISELVDVVNDGMLNLLNGIASLQRSVCNPHVPTLVAKSV